MKRIAADLQTALNAKASSSLLGAANGVATLDASSLVPLAQIPTNLTGKNAANVTGTVAVANGGTGITAAPSTSGQYLRSTGAGTWAVGTISSTDLPSLNYLAKNVADTSSATIAASGGQVLSLTQNNTTAATATRSVLKLTDSTTAPGSNDYLVIGQSPTTYSVSSAGSQKMAGQIRMGSETGTADAPTVFGTSASYTGLITRRVNSSTTAWGTVVARTDTITFERDGNGGFQVRLTASSGTPVASCEGTDSTGGVSGSFNALSGVGSVTSILLPSDLRMINCMFGDPSGGHHTEIRLFRGSGSTWVGSLTSTFNQ